jgi:hypothetical protein
LGLLEQTVEFGNLSLMLRADPESLMNRDMQDSKNPGQRWPVKLSNQQSPAKPVV